jgi:hypothetical protein
MSVMICIEADAGATLAIEATIMAAARIILFICSSIDNLVTEFATGPASPGGRRDCVKWLTAIRRPLCPVGRANRLDWP